MIDEIGDIKRLNERLEQQRQLSIDLLNLFNHKGDFVEVVKQALVMLKNFSGCEAVGLRMQDGYDFPYYATNGFIEGHVEMENRLCTRGSNGKVILDHQGNPVLDCMCGNIIKGRFDQDLPFFTKGGSFWTNSTTSLLASTTEEDRQAHTRNRCNGEGYESVALIPIRVMDSNIGLLQFNDSCPDRFTTELIKFYEYICTSLGIIISRKKAEEEILYLSFHDQLTGLYNRRFFEEELTRLDCPRQFPLSVIMGDLNGLKIINDVFGHLEGDRLIKETSKILRRVCRSDDILARWGGDEFVILLPKTSIIDTEEIIERIRKECKKTASQKMPISLSIGFAQKETADQDIQDIIKYADKSMYRNKLDQKENISHSELLKS